MYYFFKSKYLFCVLLHKKILEDLINECTIT